MNQFSNALTRHTPPHSGPVLRLGKDFLLPILDDYPDLHEYMLIVAISRQERMKVGEGLPYHSQTVMSFLAIRPSSTYDPAPPYHTRLANTADSPTFTFTPRSPSPYSPLHHGHRTLTQ